LDDSLEFYLVNPAYSFKQKLQFEAPSPLDNSAHAMAACNENQFAIVTASQLFICSLSGLVLQVYQIHQMCVTLISSALDRFFVLENQEVKSVRGEEIEIIYCQKIVHSFVINSAGTFLCRNGPKESEIEILGDRTLKCGQVIAFDSRDDYIAVLLKSKVLTIERLSDGKKMAVSVPDKAVYCKIEKTQKIICGLLAAERTLRVHVIAEVTSFCIDVPLQLMPKDNGDEMDAEELEGSPLSGLVPSFLTEMDDEREEEESEYLTQTDDEKPPKPDPLGKVADEKEESPSPSPSQSDESTDDDADVETGECYRAY
jgi:hypothetical protein